MDGILCENDYGVEATLQPDLQMDKTKEFISEKGEHIIIPSPAMPANDGEHYLAILDVWQRHVTNLEDSYIQEKALGDVDTATRTKIAWQVKLVNVESHFGDIQQPTITFDKDVYIPGQAVRVRVRVVNPLRKENKKIRTIVVGITASREVEEGVKLELRQAERNPNEFMGEFTFAVSNEGVVFMRIGDMTQPIPGLKVGGQFRAIYKYGRGEEIVSDVATLEAQPEVSDVATLEAQPEVSDLSDLLDHAFAQIHKPTNGKMKARSSPSPEVKSHCSPYETAGYQKLENQLYRIEVHDSGNLDSATFKWSRDNGTIVSRVTGFRSADSQILIEKRGKDKFLDFAVQQWVEVTDDFHESLGFPGTLVKLVSVDDTTLKYDPATVYGKPIHESNYASNPKVRRWESRLGQKASAERAFGCAGRRAYCRCQLPE